MATISIADSDARVQYTQAVTANSTQLTIDFPFFSLDDINVIVTSASGTDTTLTRGTGTGTFAVNGTSVDDGFSGGNITLGDTYSSSSTKFTIFRDIPVTRTSDFPTSGPFNISALNTELDKIFAIEQELETKLNRTMKLADSDTAATLSLPNIDTRKGTVLAFNTVTGLPEAGPSIGDISTINAITADIATLADIEDGTDATDAIQTVAGISANVTSVAGNSANIAAVGGIASNITTVAGIASNVTTVAGKASFITADFVADLNTLATADIVSDLNTLATSAIVTDMDALANIATELDALGDITSNVTTVAGISSNVTTVAGVAANVTTVAGISSNVSTVAGNSSNINTVATNNANVTTVASNISGVNSFAERYRVGSSDPSSSLDEGDLAYNTTSNQLKYYNGSSWAAISPGITDIVQDTSPQLGGNLDLNSNNITGTGNIPAGNLTGALPAIDGSALTGIDSFPSGTLMLFQQTAAPTGWTKQTSYNNRALRVVNGTAGVGGSAGFTSAFGTPTVSGSVSISGAPNVSGNIGSTTLSNSQIPSHSHGAGNYQATGNRRVGSGGSGAHLSITDAAATSSYSLSVSGNSSSSGSSGSHNHSHNLTGAVGNLAAALSSSTATINVAYIDVIIAAKD